MKRTTFTFLALAILAVAIFPFGTYAEGVTVSESDAISTARSAFMDVCGLTEEDAAKYIATATLEDRSAKGQESMWLVRFEYDTPYSLGFKYYTVRISASSGIATYDSNTQEFMDFMKRFQSWEAMAQEQEAMEREKGPYRNWSESDKATFASKFPDASFSEEQQFPQPEDMQLWEASELAKKAVIAKYGITQEEIEALRLTGDFFAQENPRAWTIGFSEGETTKYAVTLSSPDGTIKTVEMY